MAAVAPAGLARVSGFTAEATGFARAYAGATARRTMTQHLYELGRLTPPDVPGELVALTDDLVDLTDRWYLDFGAETGQPTRPDSAEKKRRLVRAGRHWLWQVDGTPVCMVAHNPAVAGATRIGFRPVGEWTDWRLEY